MIRMGVNADAVMPVNYIGMIGVRIGADACQKVTLKVPVSVRFPVAGVPLTGAMVTE